MGCRVLLGLFQRANNVHLANCIYFSCKIHYHDLQLVIYCYPGYVLVGIDYICQVIRDDFVG